MKIITTVSFRIWLVNLSNENVGLVKNLTEHIFRLY